MMKRGDVVFLGRGAVTLGVTGIGTLVVDDPRVHDKWLLLIASPGSPFTPTHSRECCLDTPDVCSRSASPLS